MHHIWCGLTVAALAHRGLFAFNVVFVTRRNMLKRPGEFLSLNQL